MTWLSENWASSRGHLIGKSSISLPRDSSAEPSDRELAPPDWHRFWEIVRNRPKTWSKASPSYVDKKCDALNRLFEMSNVDFDQKWWQIVDPKIHVFFTTWFWKPPEPDYKFFLLNHSQKKFPKFIFRIPPAPPFKLKIRSDREMNLDTFCMSPDLSNLKRGAGRIGHFNL